MKMVKDLEKLKPGDHFMLKDIEWVCLDPDYTEYDGQKGIFAIMAKLNGKSIKFCDDEDRDDWSNYAKSPIRTCSYSALPLRVKARKRRDLHCGWQTTY